MPNYGVSVAEIIMPGADLSEQISTAGTEASGTGNMKLALNGALTIGTDDGANIEIRAARRRRQHLHLRPAARPRSQALREGGYQPMRIYESNPRAEGGARRDRRRRFSPDEPGRYRGLVDSLLWGGDHYLLLADYDAYVAGAGARRRAVPRAARPGRARAIANVAGHGHVLVGPHDPRVRDRDLERDAEPVSAHGRSKALAPERDQRERLPWHEPRRA